MERLLSDLIRLLPKDRFDLHLVTLRGMGRFAQDLEHHATLHLVPPQSKISLIHAPKLIRLFEQLQPDLVNTHSGVWLKVSRAARAARVPAIVHTEHGRGVPDRLQARLVDNLASRWTDRVIAVSEAVAGDLRAKVVVDSTPVQVILNGVDTDRFVPRANAARLRQELGIGPDELVIGSVGRLEPIKRYDLAIQAFARLTQRSSAQRPLLLLAGDGSEQQPLRSLADQLGIAESVRFLGWRDDAENLYPAFDIFTMSSRSEGTSVSLLEAMSTALCCVVTNVGGNADVLGPELQDHLVASGDADGLARAWQSFLDAPDRRTRSGQRARERVVRHYSVRRTAQEYGALYQQLVREKQANPIGRPSMAEMANP